MKVPHLRNLYQKVGTFGFPAVDFFNSGDNEPQGEQVRGFGYLHDGSVDTLARFFEAGAFNEDSTGTVGFRDDADRRDMADFMLAFPSDLAPVVGAQITLDAASAAAAGERLDLFVERAGARFVSKILGGVVTECDLIFRGILDGEARGGLFHPRDGTFELDRAAQARLTVDDVKGLAAAAGNVLTFTCAPPGSGRRTGLDRDKDGAYDRDELDAGSDPADASSRPPPVPDITLEPASRNFGEVAVGSVAAPRHVAVRNDGERPLRVAAIVVRGADRTRFRLVDDTCSRKTLQPRASCRFRITFEPASPGVKRALVVVPSNDPDESQVRVTLRGTGSE